MATARTYVRLRRCLGILVDAHCTMIMEHNVYRSKLQLFDDMQRWIVDWMAGYSESTSWKGGRNLTAITNEEEMEEREMNE